MPNAVPFEERTRRAQIHAMRAVALDVIADYPVEPTRLVLLDHAHNTTFRVDTSDGRRFALRINLNSRSSSANLDAETAWLTALAADSDVVTPVPLATGDGRLHTSRWSVDVFRDLSVVMMSWLPGRGLDPPTPAALHELGRLTAALHDHAAGWTPPPGAGFPSHASVLVDDPNRIQGDHPMLTPAVRDVVDEALAVTQAHYDALHASATSRVLHADLHGGNVKWLRNRMAVFDFDDAVYGVPVLDLGISAFYLRGTLDEEPLLEGYSSVAPMPEFDQAQFEALLAGRNLLLLNEMLAAMTANIRAMQQRYVDNTVLRLRAYLETGTFRHDVPGMLPLEW